MKLNLGCGRTSITSEIGVDRARTDGCQIQADVFALPFADGSVEQVRMDHLLEHLPLRFAHTTLLEAARVLQPLGRLIVGVPDFKAMCHAYLRLRSLSDHVALMVHFYGDQEHAGQFHCSGWDVQSLCDLLNSAGFGILAIDDDPDRGQPACLRMIAAKLPAEVSA